MYTIDESDLQELKFDFRIVLGTIIGFFGAAFGSVGGVGGGGIFVPMLTLIIGFDAKSATAISKCKDMHIHLQFFWGSLNILTNMNGFALTLWSLD